MTCGTDFPSSTAFQRSGEGLASPWVVTTGWPFTVFTVLTRCAYDTSSPGGTNRMMSPGLTSDTGIGRVSSRAPGSNVPRMLPVSTVWVVTLSETMA
jgi:hypothetical protein